MSEPLPTVDPPKPPRVVSVEIWAKEKKTPAWLFTAAARGARWEVGPQYEATECGEEAFDRAIAFAANPHAVVNAPKEP